MSTVMINGTLTRDPELRNGGKTQVCSMRLVELGGRKESPLYVSVSAFGRQAENSSKYLAKGRHVAVSGQLRYREWEGDDGKKHSEHSIAADRVDFLPGGERKRNGSGNGSGNESGGGSRSESRDEFYE